MAPTTRKRARSKDVINGEQIANLARKTKKSHQNETLSTGEQLYVVGDLVRARAKEPAIQHEPLFYYPSTGTEYVGYTPSDLEKLSNKAAACYNRLVPRRTSSDETPRVVGLLGPSNLDYLMALMALSKLGHTVLFLSTRISEEAHVSLLNVSKATHLLVDEGFRSMGENVLRRVSNLTSSSITSKDEYEKLEELDFTDSPLDPLRETKNVAWIIHSSGSTSLPKPNFQTHAAALGNFKSQWNLIGFVTLPLYHMQGLGVVFRSIMNRKPIYMYNAALPLTAKHLSKTLREHREIQIVYLVPYAAKLLADSDEGLELCKELEVLFCGGGPCPKPVGDKLAKAGVYLINHYGSSETGQLMNSFRPREEIAEWDWMRPSAAVQPYLRWEPYDYENNIFELVVLPGWPSKIATNRHDGSYATKDLWERHRDFPKGKNAWRYYARRDDTIVLSNGEKANPILFEELTRESPLVEETIVFGVQKPHLGLFVTAFDRDAKEEEIIEEIWPSVEKGNKVAPAHAQISKNMISLLSSEDSAKIRKTDKIGVIRAAFYKEFESLIDSMYDEKSNGEALALEGEDLKSFIRKEVRDVVQADRKEKVKDDIDLFALGIDSLQASRLRSTILKSIDTGSEKLGENFVFDFPSINAMADEIVRMRLGTEKMNGVSVVARMQHMIDESGQKFARHDGNLQKPGQHVLVTGATGSLGAHLVAQLAAREDVVAIHCLVRTESGSDAEALKRVQSSLNERQLKVNLERIKAWSANFGKNQLGLSTNEWNDISQRLTCVFHCAWTVNFNLGLESFEDCIKGTRQLIDMCLESKQPKPASFVFCSSISVAGNAPETKIAEHLPTSLEDAKGMGYAQSKLIAEHICMNAMKETDMDIQVMRIGQIVGDTIHGIWNRQEAIPMMIESAFTVGALPNVEEQHSWLPVDTVAAGLIEISLDSDATGVFNIVNHQTFDWSHDLLPLLKGAGLNFEVVEAQEWLRRLEQRPDPVANKPYRLIEFFRKKYGNSDRMPEKVYSSERARAHSPSLAAATGVDQGMVSKLVEYIIEEHK